MGGIIVHVANAVGDLRLELLKGTCGDIISTEGAKRFGAEELLARVVQMLRELWSSGHYGLDGGEGGLPFLGVCVKQLSNIDVLVRLDDRWRFGQRQDAWGKTAAEAKAVIICLLVASNDPQRWYDCDAGKVECVNRGSYR